MVHDSGRSIILNHAVIFSFRPVHETKGLQLTVDVRLIHVPHVASKKGEGERGAKGAS